MALVTRVTKPSISGYQPPFNAQLGSNLKAGEAIATGDFVYIKAADGLVYKSNGTAATEPARTDGIMLDPPAAIGDAVTIYGDVDVEYGTGMTPGARFYVAATAGRLDTATTTGGLVAVAMATDATRIRVFGPK